MAQLVDASLFISYARADDTTDGGAIQLFAERLSDTYEAAYGNRIQIFIDRRDIRWGEQWKRRLDQELRENTFLVAIVTPRFLASTHCRDEVLEYSAVSRKVDAPQLLLPLIWRRTPALVPADHGDPVIAALTSAQAFDATELRLLEPTSATYRRALEEIAERLHETIGALSLRRPADPATTDDPLDDSGTDVLAELEEFEELAIQLPPTGNLWIASLQRAMAALSTSPTPPTSGSASTVRRWVTQLANATDGPAEELRDETAKLRKLWSRLDRVVARIVSANSAFSGPEQPDGTADFRETLADLARSFDGFGETDSAQIESMLDGISQIRQLRPFADTVRDALRLYQDMRSGTRAWAAAAS